MGKESRGRSYSKGQRDLWRSFGWFICKFSWFDTGKVSNNSVGHELKSTAHRALRVDHELPSSLETDLLNVYNSLSDFKHKSNFINTHWTLDYLLKMLWGQNTETSNSANSGGAVKGFVTQNLTGHLSMMSINPQSLKYLLWSQLHIRKNTVNSLHLSALPLFTQFELLLTLFSVDLLR